MVACQIRNLDKGFGAEVIGLDPTREIDAETRQALRNAFDDRGVLLLRDMKIDFAWQDTFCRMLIGDETPGATEARKEMHVSNKEEDGLAPNGRLMFHADMMWHEEQFRVLSLYAITTEPGSATTTLTSAAHGWETLPGELREQIEGKHARHQTGQVYHRGGDDLARPQRTHEQSRVTDVPYLHPVTGKPLLYVSQQMTINVEELPDDESEALLQKLFDHLYSPEMVYEHEWRDGDLLVFDNIALQHSRGNVERDGPTRTLRKVIAPIPNIKTEAPRYERA
jgi:alpha-ketoglutarate-dependent taurine dioxygenase